MVSKQVVFCSSLCSNRPRAPLADTSCVDELPYSREPDQRDFVHYPPLVCHEKTFPDGTTAEYIHVFNRTGGNCPAAVEDYTFEEFTGGKGPGENGGYKSLRVLKTRPGGEEEQCEMGRRPTPAYPTIERSKRGGRDH